ncbi:Leukocyte elastase inhibitor [Triplophysa tibetana]|uniref:Serpin B6 n=1 Tax=Triplophysa tibetana TaxID=1572043 RepID=A0A5A9PFG2_9TELE|nr:Leukocyte elastase inhibitor [Triplophysa tibetana]
MNSIYPVILANTKFSIDLLKAVCKTSNVLFSPLSISSALGQVVLGAGGKTADQMMKTLHFGQMKIMYHDLYEAINKKSAVNKLMLANRLYGEKSCDFKDEYLDHCEDWCFGSLRVVDFKNHPEDARVKINNWVSNKTQNTLGSLLDKGDVDKDTLLVLLSTMYIKGTWHTQFPPTETKDQPFHTNQGDSKNVQMMSQTGNYPLATIDEADCRILELFYEQKDLSMFVLLPNQMDLGKIESLITYEKLQEWMEEDKFLPTEMKMTLPKMEMEGTFDLEKILTSLGIIDAFTDKCDFSVMTSNPLKLSKVVHKSIININEQGTEAEAGSGATTTMLKSKKCDSTDGNQVSFVADHPFLFFIRHNDTKSILFWGRYCSP